MKNVLLYSCSLYFSCHARNLLHINPSAASSRLKLKHYKHINHPTHIAHAHTYQTKSKHIQQLSHPIPTTSQCASHKISISSFCQSAYSQISIYHKDILIACLSSIIIIYSALHMCRHYSINSQATSTTATTEPQTSIAISQETHKEFFQNAILNNPDTTSAIITTVSEDISQQTASDTTITSLNASEQPEELVTASVSAANTPISFDKPLLASLARVTLKNWLEIFDMQLDTIVKYKSGELLYILNTDKSMLIILPHKKIPAFWECMLCNDSQPCNDSTSIDNLYKSKIKYRIKCMTMIDISAFIVQHTYGKILENDQVLRDMKITDIQTHNNYIYFKNQHNLIFHLQDSRSPHVIYKTTGAKLLTSLSGITDFELNVCM